MWFCLARQPLPALPLVLAGKARQVTSQAWQDKDSPQPAQNLTTQLQALEEGKGWKHMTREMVGGWAGQGSLGKDELHSYRTTPQGK